MFRNKVYALSAWQCASLLLLDLFLQEIMMAWECMTYVATILLQIFIKENLDETLSQLWGKIDSQEKYQDKRCISEKIKQNTNDATFPNPKLVLSRLNFFSWTLGWGKVHDYGWINELTGGTCCFTDIKSEEVLCLRKGCRPEKPFPYISSTRFCNNCTKSG